MTHSEILSEFSLVASRKLAVSTEQSYKVWIGKYLGFLKTPEGQTAL